MSIDFTIHGRFAEDMLRGNLFQYRVPARPSVPAERYHRRPSDYNQSGK